MSYEIGDDISDGMSDCCSAAVSNPSGIGSEGRCMDCKEMCEIVLGDESDE